MTVPYFNYPETFTSDKPIRTLEVLDYPMILLYLKDHIRTMTALTGVGDESVGCAGLVANCAKESSVNCGRMHDVL